MSSNSGWIWDPNRWQYYTYLPAEGNYYYEDGTRIPAAGPTSNVPVQQPSDMAAAFSRLSVGSASDTGSPTPVRSPHLNTSIFRDPDGRFTDPELQRKGYRSYTKIGGTGGEVETLDKRYKVRKPGTQFFTRGKVFRVLWPELAGNPNEGTVLSQGKFNEPVHMKIRWFVVIREGPNYCSCIPIQTYSGQGAAKPGLQIWEHAIIYTGDREPRPKEGEKPSPDTHGMQPSIRVKPRTRSDRMDEMSRVNFAKIYTVEHNVKVFEFGDVRPEFMKRLLKNFVAVWDIAEFRNEEASGDEQEEGAGQGDSAEDNDDDDDNDYDDDTTGGSEAQEPSQGMARHNYRLAHWIQYLRSANQGAQADQLQTAPYPQQVQIMERYGAASGTSGRGKQPQR